MSGVPRLSKGQKYDLVCVKCGSKALVRGTTDIREPEKPDTEGGEEVWGGSESRTEFLCDRKTCGHVSMLVLHVGPDGVSLNWRDFEQRKENILEVPANDRN